MGPTESEKTMKKGFFLARRRHTPHRGNVIFAFFEKRRFYGRLASSRIRKITSCSWSFALLQRKNPGVHNHAQGKIPVFSCRCHTIKRQKVANSCREKREIAQILAWLRDNYLHTNGQRTARDAEVAL